MLVVKYVRILINKDIHPRLANIGRRNNHNNYMSTSNMLFKLPMIWREQCFKTVVRIFEHR